MRIYLGFGSIDVDNYVEKRTLALVGFWCNTKTDKRLRLLDICQFHPLLMSYFNIYLFRLQSQCVLLSNSECQGRLTMFDLMYKGLIPLKSPVLIYYRPVKTWLHVTLHLTRLGLQNGLLVPCVTFLDQRTS